MSCCNGQQTPHQNDTPNQDSSKRVGGAFENGEFMYIGMPEKIYPCDTSPGWEQRGQKLLITGTIYQNDGKTPAPNVILYYYHTDVNGHYASRNGLDSRVVRHGYIRGWVKTGEDGKYSIYTVRPSPYPDTNIPAHIHPAIKEPDLDKEYYIDEFVFDDDKFLTGEKRKAMENRGGSGILRLLVHDSLQIAEHDIVLGVNVPNYPKKKKKEQSSGLAIGHDQPSFGPYHAYGPDKGSTACPVCKYGRYYGVLYFAGPNENWNDIKDWLLFLEKESLRRKNRFKAYLIYATGPGFKKENVRKDLEKLGEELKLREVAVTFVPAFNDSDSEVDRNHINSSVRNTIIIYKNGTIIDKFIDVEPTNQNLKKLSVLMEKKQGTFFDLPRLQ